MKAAPGHRDVQDEPIPDSKETMARIIGKGDARKREKCLVRERISGIISVRGNPALIDAGYACLRQGPLSCTTVNPKILLFRLIALSTRGCRREKPPHLH
jgi:hypothetical protein